MHHSPVSDLGLPNPFPVARYRLHCHVERALRLPDYAGSTLRGVFGHALRDLVCLTHQPTCSACALYRSCFYPAIFESPAPEGYRAPAFHQAPNPFAIEPMGWGALDLESGAKFHFDLVLIGPALDRLPLIVLAWQRGLAQDVGGRRGRARIVRVQHVESGHDVWHEDDEALVDHSQCIALPQPGGTPARIRLDFLTPLRAQRQGRVLDARSLTATDILIATLRRVALLLELQLGRDTGWHFDELHTQARLVHGTGELHWQDWTRYSNRQQQAMTLGGILGSFAMDDVPAAWWPLLYLGQWLHIGKNASFGMGRYKVSSIE
jgi:hypothetical protein